MSVPMTRIVAVLGASYGGAYAAKTLAHSLPDNWRVVVIDRNSHMNHIYLFPRYSVVAGHEHKGFIPYRNVFCQTSRGSTIAVPPKDGARHLVVQGTVTKLDTHSITLSRAIPEAGITEPRLPFDYLVYALGSHSPEPINLWDTVHSGSRPANGTKQAGIEWLKNAQKRVKDAQNILIVGGGALGIQYAMDIADAYPDKGVTLLHSREQLLPKFEPAMHDHIMSRMSELGVCVILGKRLDMSSVSPTILDGTKTHKLRTQCGCEFEADLVLLCTGQRPNTELLRSMLPEAITPGGEARVNRALQIVASSAESDATSGLDALHSSHPHIFVIGDAADAFGAIKAGHTAYQQGELAARNIVKLIHRQEEGNNEPLELYTPGPPGIKVSAGLTQAVYQRNGMTGTMQDQPIDWDAAYMWKAIGYPEVQESDMYE